MTIVESISDLSARGATPLAGIRVISLAEQYPGPYATMIMADLGADVILVERPMGGDPTRRFPGHFEALNRNKRSVALDLKSAAGAKALERLVGTADVVIEGFRPGVMTRLGFGAERLRGMYSSLVYVSVSSYGQTGPLSPQGGHDLSIQGIAGFVTGEPPEPVSLPLADLASAMFAVVGTLSALLTRTTSGRGSHVDVSMLDALVSWQSTTIVSALNGLPPAPYPPKDPGYGVFGVGPHDLQHTLSIAGEDHQWRGLCQVLGLADLADVSTAQREATRSEIIPRLAEAFRAGDPEQLRIDLADRGVGFGPVNDGADVADDPQVRAREMIVMPDSDPSVRVVRQPVRFDGATGSVTRRAPALGEHTGEVLAEVGISLEEIRR